MNSEKSLDEEISCKSPHAWILRISGIQMLICIDFSTVVTYFAVYKLND